VESQTETGSMASNRGRKSLKQSQSTGTTQENTCSTPPVTKKDKKRRKSKKKKFKKRTKKKIQMSPNQIKENRKMKNYFQRKKNLC